MVEFDIKPESCPNALNTKGKGVLPVAILGTADFDVTTIDPSTVQLEGVPALRWNMEDVATPVPTNGLDECDCTTEGPDGLLDFSFKFNKQAVIAANAALSGGSGGDEVVLTLTGKLQDGTTIEGNDCVVITAVGGGPQSGGSSTFPTIFTLHQNEPNPFHGSTVIRYSLPVTTQATLKVYDLTGREVRTLVDGKQEAGSYSVTWDGRDNQGEKAVAGIYFTRLASRIGQASDFTSTMKTILLR
ncbi:T9SS type A sorting domain-containing protein [candidate division TA06 bacterium]|nr:T9SS type A sorting domain-containing protein [candidate division TA06 bacterium]